MTIVILTVLVIFVTMVYGPIAAMLVELFPTRIRYSGLWYPVVIAAGAFIIGLLFLPETKDVDIFAADMAEEPHERPASAAI